MEGRANQKNMIKTISRENETYDSTKEKSLFPTAANIPA
jgi:hypothetical protein